MRPRKKRAIPDMLLLNKVRLNIERIRGANNVLNDVEKEITMDVYSRYDVLRLIEKVRREKVRYDHLQEPSMEIALNLSDSSEPEPMLVRAIQEYLSNTRAENESAREQELRHAMHEVLMKHEAPTKLVKGLFRAVIDYNTRQEDP